MTRKETTFEFRKRYAERIGEPFPYNNLEEWEAYAPKREAERQVALADKVYVVECEKESGTMHAVNFALKYGKPIYALDCEWSGNRYLIDHGLAKPFK